MTNFEKALYACFYFESGDTFRYWEPAVQQGLIDTQQHRNWCGYTTGKEIYSGSVDLGGETKFGIAKNGDPKLDITHLTLDQAKAIYIERYWKPLRLDELNPEVAAYVFDIAMGSWINTAAKILQRAIGVFDDGKIGSITIGKANSMSADVVISNMKLWRKRYYAENVAKLPNNKVFLKGWTRRADTYMDVYRGVK